MMSAKQEADIREAVRVVAFQAFSAAWWEALERSGGTGEEMGFKAKVLMKSMIEDAFDAWWKVQD